MAEISQAARDYLTALDKKKKLAVSRGGQAAGDALVAEQKKIADKLESEKPGGAMAVANREAMEKAAQTRLRGSTVAREVFEANSGIKNKPKTEGPKTPFDKNMNYAAPKKLPPGQGTGNNSQLTVGKPATKKKPVVGGAKADVGRRG